MTEIVLIRSGPPAAKIEMLNPPLGLLYIGAVIRKSGYRPHVIDLKVEHLTDQALVERISRIDPEAIGLSAFTPDARSMHRTAQAIRTAFPKTPIIVGGPYPTSDPESALADTSVDFAVIGEGENTFLELLDALGAGRDASGLPGLAARDSNNKAVRNPDREPIMDIDGLPFPAWDLVDIDRYATYYASTPIAKGRYLPVFTSRGCPYRCYYCHRIFGKKFRSRSPESVLAEITEIRERFGIRRIEFCDDIFNLDKERAQAVCKTIAENAPGTRLSFSNGLRADLMTADLIRSMREAGTYFASYAVESGSKRLQKETKKNIDLEKTREIIDMTVEAGIYTNGFFMMGFPTETAEEVRQTIDYACSTRLHSISAYILVPFPGSPIYRQVAGHWKELHGRTGFDYHSGVVNCSDIPNPRLIALKRRLYLEFYFKNGRIFRTLYNHPNKRSLVGFAWIMLKRLDLKKAFALRNGPHG